MHDKTFLQQVSFLNKLPLSLEAKWWLKLAGGQKKYQESNRLHVLSLMLWGLEDGEIDYLEKAETDQLLSAVSTLGHDRKPQEAWNYLLAGPDGPAVDAKELKASGGPKEAAWLLLDALDQKMRSDPNLENVYPPIYPFSPG